MTKRPSISVVITLFNKASYIAEALMSVDRQSFSDYEVIVVDDGSSDDGASIVADIAPSACLIRQSNAGVSAARNRGVACASGDFVAFLDADDIWREDHLTNLWELHLAHPYARLLANTYREIGGSRSRVTGPAKISYRNVPDFFAEAAMGISWVFTSAAMTHRESFLSIGGFKVGESRGEDLDLWIRMALQFPVAMSDYVGSFYRRVDGGLTSNWISEPDIAMRRIEYFLMQEPAPYKDHKQGLMELYNRIAIGHASDCVARGQKDAALKFLALASGSRIFIRRRFLLKVMCFMPQSVILVIQKIRRQFKSIWL